MKKCKYYKCHDIEDEIFDCSLCYCPFYTLCSKEDNYKNFDGYLLNNNILACEKCGYFHIKSNVEVYNKLKEEGKSIKDIYNYFIEIKKQDRG